MNRFLAYLLILLLLGSFGAGTYWALRARSRAGTGMPAYSVYSEDRDGLAEAAEWLRELGWEPVALTRPIQHSAERSARDELLIMAEPEGTGRLLGGPGDLTEADAAGVLRWVERGNTLLLCGRHIGRIHNALHVAVINDERASENQTLAVDLGEGGGYTDGIDRLVVEGRDAVQGNGLPLWWVDEQAGAMVLRHGQGRVIVVADPSLLTRRGLRRGDNSVFLANVAALHARDRRVYFDEYHHGLRSGSGLAGYLHANGQGWTVLLLLFVFVMATWHVAVRLGRAVPVPQTAHADAVDYASAVARIYRQAGVRHLLARTLSRDLLEALTRHLRLRRSVLPAEILAAWRQHHPAESVAEIQWLLRGVVELRKGEVSERQLLTWARTFDQFKAEVLRAR
jgi:hypothetical protein